MPSQHQYRQPQGTRSSVDDPDSDLELELNELDPFTTSRNGPPPKSRRSDERLLSQDQDSGLALRNLRMGGLRGLGDGTDRYGQLGWRIGGQGEELYGPLDDDDDGAQRNSAGSMGTNAEDDAPLIRPSTSGRRRPRNSPQPGSMSSRLGSRIRLPSFMSPHASSAPHPENGPYQKRNLEPTSTRTICVGQVQSSRFPPNTISNAKYTPWSFFPRTLYNEFSFFFNMYFLLVALSQIVPALRIGYLSTYIAPLAFVLAITLGKEALDDIARRRRDAEANSDSYTVLQFEDKRSGPTSRFASGRSGSFGRPPKGMKQKKKKEKKERDRLAEIQDEEQDLESDDQSDRRTVTVREIVKKSRDLNVGDVLKMGKDQRVPADVVILKSYVSELNTSTALPSASHDSVRVSSDLVEPVFNPHVAQTMATAAKDSSSLEYDSSSADTGGMSESFIRTDQLDGETDWKLRLASPLTQSLAPHEFLRIRVTAGTPDKKVNEFAGTVELLPEANPGYDSHIDKSAELNGSQSQGVDEAEPNSDTTSAPLTIDNTAWANTVLASSTINMAVVVYTGPQTRQAMSTSPSRSKTGLLEYEINHLTKILCLLTLSLSVFLVILGRFESTDNHEWYVNCMRFLVLFSTIIPISLRVNLDMGKTVYAWFIERDQGMPGAVVRTSTIPEDLGRVEYLLSDKTGTLTQNEMELKKIHVGTVSYANEAMDEVSTYISQGFSVQASNDAEDLPTLITPSSAYIAPSMTTTATRTRREIGSRVRDVVLALALCHNVTPTSDDVDGQTMTTYQASSPDEIAIVRWTEHVGLRLIQRDRKGMVLQSCATGRVVVRVRILETFPFTSEGKRMGIVVQFLSRPETSGSVVEDDGEIWFYQKGADTVMTSIVAANDWLDEETANMAREGLRTLVVGRKKLSLQQYQEFSSRYKQASLAIQGRDAGMARVVKDYLEQDLELLGVTGVEDKLQRDVKPSLELLRNAGIKIWMLTGDKVETARCVAVSARLVSRVRRKDLAQDSLDFLRNKADACLLIDGESLALMLTQFRDDFISLAVMLPTVVACRCSPTQKADVAKLIRAHTKKRICCIGDGGNDVSMIQAADVGVGIVGKEGRQASLAADFSIGQFCHLTKLLVWHGRNSYKRSAKLAQFVIHRGLIISVCQTVYSIAQHSEPVALYKDWLLVGYATVYTMMPVFSLVLDKDVDEGLANLYPELYKELTTGRSLSYRTFFVWVLVSIYQGCIIQGLSQMLVAVDGKRMVAVSFTVLVINELVMVAFEITTWHLVMVLSLIATSIIYLGSVPFLGRYFDLAFVMSLQFLWKVVAISAIALVPPYAAKMLRRTLKPPSYRKVQGL
ncbi:MAG: putative aminophospholipid-translocase [Candelina submexicana]|nr:MAG: putative aminophospholipid-translocase [Candelina submexicana]